MPSPAAPPRPSRLPSLPRPAAFAATAVAFAALYLAAGAPTPLLVVLERRWQFPAWVLTIAFAVYAIALLAALLVTGSLSDLIGRRVVLGVALTVQCAAMVMFVVAPDIGWVIAARAVQGLATGTATTAFSAALLDHASDSRKGVAAMINGAAPAGGLGLGALLTGLAVQLTDHADAIVFTVLAVIMAAGAVAMACSPDALTRQPGALRSLVPHASVPAPVRREFVAAVPVHVAAWMLAGLFMGLVPTILATIFSERSGLLGGFTAFLEPGTAAVAGLVLGRLAPRATVLLGSAGVFLGAVVITSGIVEVSLPLLWIGGLVGGVGFGASFSGALRVISPQAAPHQRASLFASIYIVAYLSFGVPVIVAGQFIATSGLLPVVVAYSAAVVVIAAVGGLAQLARARHLRAKETSGRLRVPDPPVDLRGQTHEPTRRAS